MKKYLKIKVNNIMKLDFEKKTGGSLFRGNKKGGEVCKIQKLNSQCGINAECKNLNDSTICICNKRDGNWRYRPILRKYTDKEACRPLLETEKKAMLDVRDFYKIEEDMYNTKLWHDFDYWKEFEKLHNRYLYRQQDLDDRTNNYGMGYR